jgi:uncharacterized damage-inducible protein DinB
MTKQDLQKLIEKEFATTLKVLKAYPAEKMDYTPHEKSSPAKKLMSTFIFGLYLMNYALGDTLDSSLFKTYQPQGLPNIIRDFEKLSSQILERVKNASEQSMLVQIDFAGMKFQAIEMLSMLVHDQIHHRGQLTVYLRIAGGLVPSIYGPSADDTTTNL